MTSHLRQSQRGVTLIELLIAITLLSLLSTGMLFAIRIGLNSMGKTNTFFTNTRRVLGVDRIIAEQVAGYIPSMGLCGIVGPEAPPPQTILFFQGDAQTMRFVTSYSLNDAGRGLPRIVEYQVIPGENGAGVRLVVNEAIYTGPLSTNPYCAGTGRDELTRTTRPLWRPVIVGARSFVLADKLARCQFTFKEEIEQDNLPDRWFTRWPYETMPSAVHIEWAPLDPDASRLQLAPVTLPFRPNRSPLSGVLEN